MYCKPIQGTRPLAIKDDLIKFKYLNIHLLKRSCKKKI